MCRRQHFPNYKFYSGKSNSQILNTEILLIEEGQYFVSMQTFDVEIINFIGPTFSI